MGREWSYRNQFGENVSFPRRSMKFQIILSKIMSKRKIAESAKHSVSRGSRRGFQLTEKLPREKQSPIERTWRHPRKPKRNTSRPESGNNPHSGKKVRLSRSSSNKEAWDSDSASGVDSES